MPDKNGYAPGELSWVDLSTDDIDGAVRFYGALFGWDFERGGDDVGGYSNAMRDGKRICGISPKMMPGMPTVWSTYIATDDADKTAELVQSNGGTVVAPPMDVMDLGRMAVFLDPTGAAIGVWQGGTHKGAQLVGEEGVVGWTELASRDRARALPFYEAVFGWTRGGADEYTEFHANGQPVAGALDMPEMVPAEVPSYWMPYFNAQDPAAKAQEAAGLGATVLVPFMEMDNVAFSCVMDPEGATFGLLRVNG